MNNKVITAPLFDVSKSKNSHMKVAGLMSGSGSNLRAIIEYGLTGASGYRVHVIFSDNADSNAVKIGRDYDIPVITRDITAFYKGCGRPRTNLLVREEFDKETVRMLKGFDIDVLAYAGYMSIATQVLSGSFLGVNVHPADLFVLNEKGERKYTGGHAVRDAIVAGEKTIRATTHIVSNYVDNGPILMRSAPLEVVLGEGFDPSNKEHVKKAERENQERLKINGDMMIFHRTLRLIALGSFTQDEEGSIYYHGKPAPNGVRYEEIMRGAE